MVIALPAGAFTMKTKRSIIKLNAKKYQKSRKKQKKEILDEIVISTGYKRYYAAKLLRTHDKYIKYGNIKYKCDVGKTSENRRGRKSKYPSCIDNYLYEVWKESGSISSKHLVIYIEENIEHLMSGKAFLDITEENKALLLQIKHATIDRRLKKKREKHYSKQRYRVNRGVNHIKKLIPVERHGDRKVNKLGYIDIDLVHHSGGNPSGDFLYTLTTVDALIDWVSLRILKNKARVWTCNALKDIRGKLPFNMKHIHSDNGGEFINEHLYQYSQIEGAKIGFSRSRPYTKNDNPLVECKNWTVVRQYVGYRRYDTEKEMKALSKLYNLIELKHNLFVPSMKTIEKKYINGKVHRKYSIKSPLKRLLESSFIDESTKNQLINLKNSIDLFELNRNIKYYQKKLDKCYSCKRH